MHELYLGNNFRKTNNKYKNAGKFTFKTMLAFFQYDSDTFIEVKQLLKNCPCAVSTNALARRSLYLWVCCGGRGHV